MFQDTLPTRAKKKNHHTLKSTRRKQAKEQIIGYPIQVLIHVIARVPISTQNKLPMISDTSLMPKGLFK